MTERLDHPEAANSRTVAGELFIAGEPRDEGSRGTDAGGLEGAFTVLDSLPPGPVAHLQRGELDFLSPFGTGRCLRASQLWRERVLPGEQEVVTMSGNGVATTKAVTSELSGGGAIREATPGAVAGWLRTGECVLVDVREADEHARERIAGARLVPLSRFDPRSAAVLVAPGQKLVIHCKGGRRSADACRMMGLMRDPGFEVYSMTGGIEAWRKEALPTEVDPRAPGISIMRQVQIVVGVSVLAGSLLAWFHDPLWIALPAFFGAGLTFAGVSGTCALATVLGCMPWNKVKACGASCASGKCG